MRLSGGAPGLSKFWIVEAELSTVLSEREGMKACHQQSKSVPTRIWAEVGIVAVVSEKAKAMTPQAHLYDSSRSIRKRVVWYQLASL
jgi:NADPH-dependent 2,4-dienoyl-CoA reductase/sulfur reductase-like enzyme